MQHKSCFITCADGHQMPVYEWLPVSEPDAVLHIAHGMAEYAERYAEIASFFTKNNIALYAHDQRGHGKAVAAVTDQGMVEDDWFNKQVEDICLLIPFLRNKYPGKKIFLAGHSMGSFICQRYFQIHGKDIDGLILSASNGKSDPLMNAGIAIAWLQMKMMGSSLRSNLLNKLSFGKFNSSFKPNRTNYDWLSRNNEAVDKYIADPQCGFICSASFFFYFFNGIKDAFKKTHIKNIPAQIPVYAFSGDNDPVGLFGKGFLTLINNWKAAGVKDISYNLYKGGRHEMMNEINRQEVIDDLITWIKKHS